MSMCCQLHSTLIYVRVFMCSILISLPSETDNPTHKLQSTVLLSVVKHFHYQWGGRLGRGSLLPLLLVTFTFAASFGSVRFVSIMAWRVWSWWMLHILTVLNSILQNRDEVDLLFQSWSTKSEYFTFRQIQVPFLLLRLMFVLHWVEWWMSLRGCHTRCRL